MGRTRIQTFIASSDPMKDAYGGVRLSEQVIEDIASKVARGEMPFHSEHDSRRPVTVDVRAVELRRTTRGGLGVWVEGDVDDDLAKGWRGFSVSGSTLAYESPGEAEGRELNLTCDASHFSDEQLIKAARSFERYFHVTASRLYQFSVDVPAKIILELATGTLMALPPEILSDLLWTAIKPLFMRSRRRRSKTIVELRIDDADTVRRAVIETSDPNISREALSTVRDVMIAKGPTCKINYGDHGWEDSE